MKQTKQGEDVSLLNYRGKKETSKWIPDSHTGNSQEQPQGTVHN